MIEIIGCTVAGLDLYRLIDRSKIHFQVQVGCEKNRLLIGECLARCPFLCLLRLRVDVARAPWDCSANSILVLKLKFGKMVMGPVAGGSPILS